MISWLLHANQTRFLIDDYAPQSLVELNKVGASDNIDNAYWKPLSSSISRPSVSLVDEKYTNTNAPICCPNQQPEFLTSTKYSHNVK